MTMNHSASALVIYPGWRHGSASMCQWRAGKPVAREA